MHTIFHPAKSTSIGLQGGIVLQQIGVIFVQEGLIGTPALPKFTSGIPLQLVESDNSSFVLIVLEQGFSTQ